ncbi:MarR family transcriptional regulator [Streptomyces globosus]|uniref:MarR family transcriptional regulator n=1 Tax=Streptomyces globosus TaxID=68209 RepID=A0A344TUE1_9ACTN|nr:MarR family winged helix-turn-helix transcriptional regulator [Streptomyces globosus]AXE22262.1 MarR family transcriptional regulator [Streptomyces globosus]
MPERAAAGGTAAGSGRGGGGGGGGDGGGSGGGEGLSTRERQELLSAAALGVFGLNGRFLALSEELARPAGLTAARWQVLGAVLREPLPVAGIARAMGITRQSVQRVADLLAAQGLAEYVANPAHRRAKLLRPTREGHAAVARIGPAHAAAATALAEHLGDEAFREVVAALDRLAAAMDALPGPPAPPSGD